MNEEGYIKFNPIWNRESFFVSEQQLGLINTTRSRLIEKKWLGVLPDGVGFGNISIRKDKQFIITGSGTGAKKDLKTSDLALVTSVEILKNRLQCIGETVASSESMSHAVIYEQVPAANAVIHIHSRQLWLKYINKLPCSSPQAAYGTPEMAISIRKTVAKTTQNVIIMGGHEDGIIAFGPSLENALRVLESLIP